MKTKNLNAEWAGCSNLQERREELLKAHEEFQRLMEDGWKIASATKVRRPRIIKASRPRYVITIVLGKEVKVSIEDFTKHYAGFKKVREIY